MRGCLIFFHALWFLMLLGLEPIGDRNLWCDEVRAEHRAPSATEKLLQFDKNLSLEDRRVLKQSASTDRHRLSPRQRTLYDERLQLKAEDDYWRNVVALKHDFLKMPGATDEREAEEIAETAIRGFSELRGKYEMLRPAIFHNMLVNMGLKNEGLCWQWTRDLTKRLRELHLKSYDLLWATAREATMREHNTVVVVTHGHPLEDGIFLDGWTKSGKPYWKRIPEDHKHPWKLGSYHGDDLEPEDTQK